MRKYLTDTITLVPEYDLIDLRPDPYQVLRCGQCGEHAFPVFYVAACRSLGIAARLHPTLRYPEYADIRGGKAIWVRADTRDLPDSSGGSSIAVTLRNASGQPLAYETHFTIGRFNGTCYDTLLYPELVLTDSAELMLPRGAYRIITTRRQIDGTASSRLIQFHTDTVDNIELTLMEDKTAERLKSVPLRNPELLRLNAANAGRYSFLVCAEPGKEPTEHLLRELIAEKDEIARNHIAVLLLDVTGNGDANETYRYCCYNAFDCEKGEITNESYHFKFFCR